MSLFELLRHQGFAFGGGEHGWPPAAVFEDLRKRGHLAGAFVEVVWKGPGKWILRHNQGASSH